MSKRETAPGVGFKRYPGGLALATLSGVLWFLACTPYDLSALGWIAAVPMLIAIDRAPTLRQALLVGWWAGIVENAGGFSWIVQVLERFAGLPLIASLAIFAIFCAYQGVVLLLFTLLVRLIRAHGPVPFTLLSPLLIAVCEWLLPELFPYGRFITQAWHPLFIQIAEITGPYGVTALLMLVNGALYDVFTQRRQALIPAFGAAAVLLAALLFGVFRMRQLDDAIAHAPPVEIGVVQPNTVYRVRGRFTQEAAQAQLARLQSETQRLEQAGAKLVVWSEGSYPFRLPPQFTVDFPTDSPHHIRRDIGVPVIIGGLTAERVGDEPFNSAVLLDSQGKAVGRYDKVRLIAFGERIPKIEYFPWLRRRLPEGAGRFMPGAGPQVLQAEGLSTRPLRLAPVICYEDILPGYLRSVGALHPDLLVNLTSDSWFGARTEPWQHLALAVFASVELRTGMVRAVNSGVSAYIDPTGRVVDKTYAIDPYLDSPPADGRVFSVAMLPGGRTFYAMFGNIFVYACIGASAIIAIFTVRRERMVGTRAARDLLDVAT